MSIKFLGVMGKNRLHLIPASDDATLTVDNEPDTVPRRNFEETWDGGYGICLTPNNISCVGAWDTLVIHNNLNYDTSWYIYLNGREFGPFGEFNPIDYAGRWEFDWMISCGVINNDLYISNTSGGDLKISIVPEVVVRGYVPSLGDSDSLYGIREVSEMAVFDTNTGAIQVCLRTSPMLEELN